MHVSEELTPPRTTEIRSSFSRFHLPSPAICTIAKDTYTLTDTHTVYIVNTHPCNNNPFPTIDYHSILTQNNQIVAIRSNNLFPSCFTISLLLNPHYYSPLLSPPSPFYCPYTHITTAANHGPTAPSNPS